MNKDIEIFADQAEVSTWNDSYVNASSLEALSMAQSEIYEEIMRRRGDTIRTLRLQYPFLGKIRPLQHLVPIRIVGDVGNVHHIPGLDDPNRRNRLTLSDHSGEMEVGIPNWLEGNVWGLPSRDFLRETRWNGPVKLLRDMRNGGTTRLMSIENLPAEGSQVHEMRAEAPIRVVPSFGLGS